MTEPAPPSQPLGLDDLLAPFHDAEKPPERWLVGTEAEKFGVLLEDGSPLPYEGELGVRRVLHDLAERHGWEEQRETTEGDLIALRRGGASITLEPGGQLELSGAPMRCVHQSVSEVEGHAAELGALSADLGITWLGLGYHPWARQEDLPWVPKLRYGVMREYLPTRCARGLDMMRRTCTVQANLDYRDEADAFRKLGVSLRLQPVATALFANSPFAEGRPTGRRSERAMVWTAMDPDRSGLLPFLWDAPGTYERYVEWALDVPMFMLKRGDRVFHNAGQTFRDYLRNGFQGLTATREDWETHLNTLFPEARLKKTLELRGADAQQTPLLGALPALWKGLLYDADALAAAESLASRLDHATVEAARPGIAEKGLLAELAGRPVAEWGVEMLEIARAGLARLDCRDRNGRQETVHLDPLIALAERAETPADALLARWRAAGEPDVRAWLITEAAGANRPRASTMAPPPAG